MNAHTIPTDHNEVADETAILAVQMSKLRASMDRFASANGSHRAMVKEVEAKGLDPKIAKRALQIKESGDSAAFVSEMTTMLRYLRILGVPVTDDQLDLFDVAPKSAPIDERASEDGLRAGRMGDDIGSCPHDHSTVAYRAWIDAYQIGSREREQILSMPAPLLKGVNDHDDGADDEFGDDALGGE